jgi:hypothetical protein
LKTFLYILRYYIIFWIFLIPVSLSALTKDEKTKVVKKNQKARVLPTLPKKEEIKKSTILSRGDLIKIQKQMQEFTSLSLFFKQKNYSKLRKKFNLQQGRAYLTRKPVEKFLWSYTKPFVDNWLFDGSAWLSWSQGDRFAVRYKTNISRGQSLKKIVEMISNFSSLTEHFRLLLAKRGAEQEIVATFLKVSPRQKEDKIIINLKQKKDKSYFVAALSIFYSSGNETHFEFYKHEYEVKLNKVLFELPKSVKVKESF